MKIQKSNQKAITLISLVITIILLLILAGIAILSITGDNGLFNYAKKARNNTLEAQELENSILANYENTLDKYVDNSRDTVTIDKNEYEQLKETVARLDNNPVVLYNNPNYTTASSTTQILEPAGTSGQTVTLSDVVSNYGKIEINIGCATFISNGYYYYPYMDTITWYPQMSITSDFYVHKATNTYSSNYVRWQLNTSKDSNQITLYTWEAVGGYWQGIFLISVLGYQ